MSTKNKILIVTAIFAVMLSMAGIAVANPCPELDTWLGKPLSDAVLIYQTDQGSGVMKYSVQSEDDKNSIEGIPGFKEVCIASGATPSNPVAMLDTWQGGIRTPAGGTFVQFDTITGNPDNIPFDSGIHDVGTVQWDATPENTQTLVHVISADICGTDGSGEPNTCFVRPGTPGTPPVPELGTIVLTSTGMLGLMLISRRYRQK